MSGPYTQLDQNQIIQRVFDETKDELKVQTEATIVAGAMEVAINDVDDSIRLGDGTNLTNVNPDGALRVSSGLIKVAYDSIYATYPTATTEVYTYKQSGSTVATVTVTYTTSTKDVLSSVVRT